jgi:Spy/CpxP family protein refolding chaperone
MKKSALMIVCAAVAAASLLMFNASRVQAEPPYGDHPGIRIEAGPGELHPHLHRVIEELEEAKHELQEAPHDFGGHREEALRATEAAITQLRLAIKFDRR